MKQHLCSNSQRSLAFSFISALQFKKNTEAEPDVLGQKLCVFTQSKKTKTKPLLPRYFIVCFLSPFFHFLVGISSVLFESRIGCLDEVVPEETECFIRCINTMFVMTLLTMAMPKWLHQLFPKPWNIFCQCWDYMFDFGKCKNKTFAKTQCTTLNTTYLT